MQTSREKVSYCIGLKAGKDIRHQFKDIDSTLLEKGFKDALEDKTPSLETDEIKEILQALQEQIRQQQKAFIEDMAETNKEEGEQFLQDHKSEPGVIVLSSGLQYQVLQAGSGPSPSSHDVVTVHYQGSFIDGTVFDSSYERGEPTQFPVNRVIPGWSEALKKMRVGDRWKVAIPHYLAYGENGYPPEIEPNTTLIFEMELLKIN